MTVRLIANGVEVREWQEVSVTDSMVDMCDSFRVSTPNTMLGDGTYLPVKPLDAIQIYHDDESEPILNGYCDEIGPNISETTNEMVAGGKSRGMDLLECSPEIDGGNLKNVTALQIAQKISEPYGIKFSVAGGVDIGDPFKVFKIEPGEVCFSSLNRAFQQRSVLPSTIKATGDIELIKPGLSRATDALTVGINCKMASGKFSVRNRFSRYAVIGQRPPERGADGKISKREPKKTNRVSALAEDSEIDRLRVKILRPGEPMTEFQAESRARWEASYRMGKSSSINLTTTSWRQSDGTRWESNMLVSVTIPQYNLYDAEMLIQKRNLVYGVNSGESAMLFLVHPDTYTPPPSKDVQTGREKSVWNRPIPPQYIGSVGSSRPGEIIDRGRR